MQKFNLQTQQLLIDTYLPHNFLAEKMILSCLLINSEAIEIQYKLFLKKLFILRIIEKFINAIICMYENQLSIDTLTLTTFLQDNGLLEQIGGIKVVIDLITQIPNLIYLEEYIRLVKDKFLRRSLIKLGYEAINSGYITNIPLETYSK
jgi:replicative DNA helicase